MNEYFKEWTPQRDSMEILISIRSILSDYEKQGYVLTLRQLYYQLVSRDVIPNSERSYKNIGNIVNRGRLAGYIDWEMIEDRARTLSERSHWNNPSEIIHAAANGYYLSRWETQKNYVEVWCEKDAVSNIIQPICRMFDVPFMANRGYSSQSAMYQAAGRLIDASAQDKDLFIIYLGDHDPSGIDMSRDIEDRLELFLRGDPVEVKRIALNLDQIRRYRPPENPTKITDSRAKGYIQKYGRSSWELDALTPEILSNLISSEIESLIDLSEWEVVEQKEDAEKAKLLKLAEGWGSED